MKNLPQNLTELDPELSWHRKKNPKKELTVVVSNGYQPVNSRWCPNSPELTSDRILLLSDESLLKGEDRKKNKVLKLNQKASYYCKIQANVRATY